MNAILEVANVSSGYGSSMVVRGASLQIAPGEIVAVIGKNGMGKTSLLKTILGFLPARSGAVMLDGRDVTRMSSHLKRRLALAAPGTIPVPGSYRSREPSARAHERCRLRSVSHESRHMVSRSDFPTSSARRNAFRG